MAEEQPFFTREVLIERIDALTLELLPDVRQTGSVIAAHAAAVLGCLSSYLEHGAESRLASAAGIYHAGIEAPREGGSAAGPSREEVYARIDVLQEETKSSHAAVSIVLGALLLNMQRHREHLLADVAEDQARSLIDPRGTGPSQMN